MLDEVTRGVGRAEGIVQERQTAHANPPIDVDPCPSWQLLRVPELREEHLASVVYNEIPAAIVPEVVTEEERARLRASLKLAPWECYADRKPPVGMVGITQADHAGGLDRRLAYFARVAGANAVHAAVFKMAGLDLLTRVLRRFGDVWPRAVRAAHDPHHGSYAPAAFRRSHGALLHHDFAAVDLPEWSTRCITEQLAWFVDLSADERPVGGETIVYRQPAREELKRFRVAGSRSYSAAAVAGVPGAVVRQRPGDLVLFNSRNLSEQLRTTSEQLTFGGFAGLTAETRELVLFS